MEERSLHVLSSEYGLEEVRVFSDRVELDVPWGIRLANSLLLISPLLSFQVILFSQAFWGGLIWLIGILTALPTGWYRTFFSKNIIVDFKKKIVFEKEWIAPAPRYLLSDFGGIDKVWSSEKREYYFFKLWRIQDRYGRGIPLCSLRHKDDSNYEDDFREKVAASFARVGIFETAQGEVEISPQTFASKEIRANGKIRYGRSVLGVLAMQGVPALSFVGLLFVLGAAYENGGLAPRIFPIALCAMLAFWFFLVMRAQRGLSAAVFDQANGTIEIAGKRTIRAEDIQGISVRANFGFVWGGMGYFRYRGVTVAVTTGEGTTNIQTFLPRDTRDAGNCLNLLQRMTGREKVLLMDTMCDETSYDEAQKFAPTCLAAVCVAALTFFAVYGYWGAR